MDFSGPSAADSKSNKYLTEPMQLPLHVVAAGATHENSDSWSDEGDLSSTGPSPGGTPSPGTSAGKKKMGRFRRANKAKGENSSDETSQNASDSLKRIINVKNCPLSSSENQLQS